MDKPRFCYFIPHVQDENVKLYGGYVPSAVFEDESGHYPMLGNGPCASPWVWGKTYQEAEEVCKKANERLGLSETEVAVIVASSMRGRFPRRDK